MFTGNGFSPNSGLIFFVTQRNLYCGATRKCDFHSILSLTGNFSCQKNAFLIKDTRDLTRENFFVNCYHILKIIDTLCEKENNGLKGEIVEKTDWKINVT